MAALSCSARVVALVDGSDGRGRLSSHKHSTQLLRWSSNGRLEHGRKVQLRLKCSYSGTTAAVPGDPIDVVAEVKTQKIVVLGGSGFVGCSVCKSAVEQGIEVVSLSRSGRPSNTASWVDQVSWLTGSVFYADWPNLLRGATAVVSMIGGFGTNEEMEKLNGEANLTAVDAAYKAGVPRFVYISVHDYKLPSFVLSNGYFAGKRKAEAEILSKYPNTGTILRPGFIYGKRRVNGIDIPLDIVGQPLESFLAATENYSGLLKPLPGSDLFLASPVSVEDVGAAAVQAVLDDSVFGVLTIEQIKEAASSLRLASL